MREPPPTQQQQSNNYYLWRLWCKDKLNLMTDDSRRYVSAEKEAGTIPSFSSCCPPACSGVLLLLLLS